jgi:flagellar biosynthetic protein FliP
MELVGFLLPLLYALWWPFARIMAMLSTAPVLGEGAVPVPLRALLAVALSFVMLPMTGGGAMPDPFSLAGVVAMIEQALKTAEVPLSKFMLAQTSKAALAQVAHLAGEPEQMAPQERAFTVKLAAFVLSELKTAFQIGAMLFIPFLIIDLVVSSVLMAMGMMMLSPLVISLPFKLLLFVLVDGWTLTVNTLVGSIHGY